MKEPPPSRPLLSVVIPAMNEQDCLEDTLGELEKKLSIPHEVIVVDDHSGDRTVEIAREFGRTHPNVRVVSNPRAAGFPRALRCGWENAAAPFIVPVMADLCDEVEAIQRMYGKMLEEYDVVCGSRNMPGGGKSGGNPVQNFFSRLVGKSARRLIGVPTCDVSNAFKMYRAGVLEWEKLLSRAFDVSMEMTLQAHFGGYRVAEVPAMWTGRKKGASKFKIFKMAPGYAKLYARAVLTSWGLRREF